MTLIDVQYKPGTQKSTQQTELSEMAFVDTDHVHFPDGRLTTLPPYAVAVFSSDYVTFLGGARAVHATKLTGTHVGTYYLIGTHSRLYAANANYLYNITPLVTSATATLGTDPLALVNGDATMTVTYAAHGLAVGDRIKFSGATHGTAGFANSYINKEHIVATVPTSGTFTVELAANAPATDATEGGAAVAIYKQIAAGNLDQAVAIGYGAGLYGEGLYGQGGASASAQTFPRIWSFGNFGNEVVMCPGDYATGDGQKIYIWDGDLTVAPTVLTNAPTNCNWVSVVNNSVVALCGRTVKISEIGDGTVWSGLTYYEKTLERVWKMVSCFTHGEKEAVIFTPNEAIILRYAGGGDLWDISDLYTEDGIIAPMAASVLDTIMHWRGARGTYSFDGSVVKKEINEQNENWLIENINYGKAWKSFATSDTKNAQWYFYFPAGSDSEPGNYVIFNPAGNHYTLGEMARTAAQRPGFVDSTFLMVNGTSASVAGAIYRHYTMGAVTFSWYAETADFGGADRFMCNLFEPDSNQSGDISLTIKTRERAQGTQSTGSAYTIASSTAWQTVKAAGRYMALRFSGSAAATLGMWKMNLIKMGRR